MANDTYDINGIIREVLTTGIDISPSDRQEWKLFCCALKVLNYDQSTFVALSSGKQSDSVKAWREERNPTKYLNEWQAKAKIIALAKNAGLDLKPFLLQNAESRPTDRQRQHRSRPRHTSTPPRKQIIAPTAPKPVKPNVYYIPTEMIEQGALQVHETGLYKFLCNEFDRVEVEEVLRKYKVGASRYTTNEGLKAVSFPLINREGNCIDCKIFHIDPKTGSRKTAPPLLKGDGNRPDLKNTFALAMMKDPDSPGKRMNDRRGDWAYFGEHLLKDLNPEQAQIGIVESEKTALILSVAYPSITWIATGSISNLTPERFTPFIGYDCTIYPDRDGYDKWNEKAQTLALQGYRIKVDTTVLTYEGKPNDDLADIVLRCKNGTQEPPTYQTRTNFIPNPYQTHTDPQGEPFYTDSDPEPTPAHSPEWVNWLVRRICRNYKDPEPTPNNH